MKKSKSQAWVGVFEELNDCMERNLDKWNSVDEIRRTYDDFLYNLKKIKKLQPELEKDHSPVKEELSGKKELLMSKLTPVGNILEVYAQDQRMVEKARILVGEWKKIDSLGFHRLLNVSAGLYKLMEKHLGRAVEGYKIPSGESSETPTVKTATLDTETGENGNPPKDPGSTEDPEFAEPRNAAYPGQAGSTDDIRRYGLTRSMLQELYIAMQQYRSTLKLRDDVLKHRKKLRRKSDGLVRTNRKLLEKRLNKLMTVLAVSYPSFYEEYSTISGSK